MRRKLTVALSAIAMALAVALPAAAAPPAGVGGGGVPDGIECQQRGIGTLIELGLIDDVAANGIYVVELETTVPFKTVLELHRTQPELFQTGGVSVLIPGPGGEPVAVAATWCDGI